MTVAYPATRALLGGNARAQDFVIVVLRIHRVLGLGNAFRLEGEKNRDACLNIGRETFFASNFDGVRRGRLHQGGGQCGVLEVS